MYIVTSIAIIIWNRFVYIGLRSNAGRLRFLRFSWSVLIVEVCTHFFKERGSDGHEHPGGVNILLVIPYVIFNHYVI